MFHIVTTKLLYLADEITNIQINHSYVNIEIERSKKKTQIKAGERNKQEITTIKFNNEAYKLSRSKIDWSS